MDVSRLNMQELVAYLVENSAEWIRAQQARHLPLSTSLPDTTRAALRGFFTSETLDRARVRWVPVIENPAFYAEFDRVGERVPLDFSVWAAITFGDVILVSQTQVPGPPPHSVIFHEMVHLVQYAVLGVEEFARRYVRRLAQSRFQYMDIPLESTAFDMQGRFERNEKRRFAAEAEIRAGLATRASRADEVDATGLSAP